MDEIIQALHDTVLSHTGLQFEVIQNMDDDEIDEAYRRATDVWAHFSKRATDTLKELAPDVAWQSKMAISQAYSMACFWNVIACQLGAVQRLRSLEE